MSEKAILNLTDKLHIIETDLDGMARTMLVFYEWFSKNYGGCEFFLMFNDLCSRMKADIEGVAYDLEEMIKE